MAMHVWNGSAWVTAKRNKVWNGSSWVNNPNGKVWNGSSWVGFLDNITLNNDFVQVEGFNQLTATWGFDTSAGYIQQSDVDGFVYETYFWIANFSNYSQYQVRAQVTAGDTPTGSALNSWISPYGAQWSISAFGTDKSCDLSVEIRHATTQTVVTSATINLNVVNLS